MNRQDRQKQRWFRGLEKGLRPLPKAERRAALCYFEEMYCDRLDAGEEPESILRAFGPPARAAARFLEENAKAAPAAGQGEACACGRADGASGGNKRHPLLAAVLFVLCGIPALAMLLALAATALALAVCGPVFIAAGLADFVYFFVQLCSGGGAACAAHLGIGLGLAGLGCLFIPLFLFLGKKLIALCGKVLAGTGRLLCGKKKEAVHA